MSHEDTPPATPLYATPAGLERSLRVVLVASRQVPGWVRAFVELAVGNDWIDLVVVTALEAALPTVSDVSVDLRAFLAYERAVLGHSDASLAPETIPSDHAGVMAEQGAPAPLHARVSALRPDLVLLLGPQAWASALAEQAPWGCWHVDASLTDPRYAGLSLLAPMMRGETATQMELVLQGPTKAPIALAGSWGRTRTTSFLMQRKDAFRKLPPLLLRALHRVAAGHVPATRRSVAILQLQSSQSPLGRAAGLRALISALRGIARSLIGRLRNRRDWMLVLRRGGTMLDPEAPVIGPHALLKAPRGWWADPCVIAADGRTLVFVEEMADPKIYKGTIACVELIDGGAHRLGIALDEPGHLSFPQPFLWQGQWYLTVESSYARRVSLYRATDFPLEWVRVRNLITGRVCVDPTLHHHEGHWYLFANVAESGNSTCDDLFLFVADSLEGPFRPHPAAPIVSDVRRARLAGRLFHHHGRLIRPAQDCAPGYGKAVVFNEVLELGPTVYRERVLSRLVPDWARRLDGCHTYNTDGDVEVLDVRGRPPADAVYLPVTDGGGFDAPAGRMHLPHHLGPAIAAQLPGGMTHPKTAQESDQGTPEAPRQRTSIVTHYLRYSMSNALVMLAGFIAFTILTRLLDNTQFGILRYYDTWMLIGVALIKLGSQHAIVRFYPYNGDPQRMRAFGTNLVLLPLVLSGMLWALAVIGLALWWRWGGGTFHPVFWGALLIMPMLAASNIVQMVMRASERSDIVMATRIIGRLLELVLVLGAVILVQHSALAVYGGKIIAAALLLAWLLHWMRRNVYVARDAIDLRALGNGLIYGLPLMAHELAHSILANLDRVLLKEITGDFAVVGIYAIGYALAMQVNVFISATLSEAFTPVSPGPTRPVAAVPFAR